MASIDQIASWTVEETREEVLKILPKGHKFVEESGAGGWLAASVRQGENILWADRGPDPKTVLVNAFGWLVLVNQKPQHPVWKPRPPGKFARLEPPPPQKAPVRPDLDPEEIKRVYDKELKKRK